MTEDPQSPGVEMHLDKAVVAGVQGALDATFNAHADGPLEDVEAHLRTELDRAGIGGALPDDRVRAMAADISAGDPVVAEPDEEAP